MGAGVSALTLGAGSHAVSARVADETCESFGELSIENGEFVVINNDWSAGVDDGVDMCSTVYDDGRYGWEWERGDVASDPNYPQVLLGTKPWGDTTDTPLFPIQRGDVEELAVELDVDNDPSGGEWNLALEWWLTEDEPGTDVSGSITHEIMLVLEWSDDHDHGPPIDSSAFTDAYGNEIDYWTNYAPHGDEEWSFHIFRVAANAVPSTVDLTAIIEYLNDQVADSHHSLTPDLWISGLEIGNEYWVNTAGETTFNTFDATLNGDTATSGIQDSSGGSDGSGEPDDDSDDSNDSSDDHDSDDGEYPTWDPDEVYNEGDRVGWDGTIWEAQWWTRDQEPREEPWYAWESVDTDSSDDSGSNDDSSDGSNDSSDDDSSQDDSSDDDDDSSDGDENGSGDTQDDSSDGPIAEQRPSTTDAVVDEQITFAVDDTSGESRWIDSLEWDFGDGTTDSGWWTVHQYDSAGSYTVTLRATDGEGDTTTHDVELTVS